MHNEENEMRKTMEINKQKLVAAKKILGAKNDTQTVDEALSVVIANEEIEKAINNLFGSMLI